MDQSNVQVEVPDKELINRLVPPHKKASRDVTELDIDRVMTESVIMWKLCFEPVGHYQSAFAVAHSQIDDKDPLNFFVTVERKIVINPVILRHSGYFVDSEEGCLSYPNEKIITVKRWRKCDVQYITLIRDMSEGVSGHPETYKLKLSEPIEEHLVGREAWITQHEIQHMSASYIYDELINNEN